ncbi:MAG: hypothetical protein ACOX2N_04235 [Peptococcia bacterium]
MDKKNTLNVCQVAFTYIGALVGAGFASGQELLKFFTVFGEKGIIGAVLSGFFFGFFGLLVIKVVARKNIENYGQLLCYLFGRRIAFFVEGLLSIFLLSSLAVMLVAGGSLFHQLWLFPFWCGFFLTAVIIGIVLLIGREGVLWLNTALIPGLVILSLIIVLLNLSQKVLVVATISKLNLIGGNWLFATCLYVSYNFILGSVILSSLGDLSKRGGEKGVLLGGIILGLMAALISFSLLNQSPHVTNQAIPLLVLAYRVHPFLGWAYFFVLWIAILTTALSISFGLLKRLEHLLTIPKYLIIILLFAPTLPFLYWSFPQMVTIIYPLIGYSGLVFLGVLLLKVLPEEILLWRRR